MILFSLNLVLRNLVVENRHALKLTHESQFVICILERHQLTHIWFFMRKFYSVDAFSGFTTLDVCILLYVKHELLIRMFNLLLLLIRELNAVYLLELPIIGAIKDRRRLKQIHALKARLVEEALIESRRTEPGSFIRHAKSWILYGIIILILYHIFLPEISEGTLLQLGLVFFYLAIQVVEKHNFACNPFVLERLLFNEAKLAHNRHVLIIKVF